MSKKGPLPVGAGLAGGAPPSSFASGSGALPSAVGMRWQVQSASGPTLQHRPLQDYDVDEYCTAGGFALASQEGELLLLKE
eukprot:8121248-Pyramimonas_sp.AAC.1